MTPAKASPPLHSHIRHHPPPTRRHKYGGALATGLILLALAVIGWSLLRDGPAKTDANRQLLDQMHQAAKGGAVPVHAFGGALTVARDNGPLMISAHGLPSKPCVQVGWLLAKEGRVMVNGTLPLRLSAARLAELCGQDEAGSTLSWLPADPP